jgi:hypothetical protein
MEMTFFKQMSGFELADASTMMVKKVSKKARALVGTIVMFSSEFDNVATVELVMFKKQGGEYRKMPYNVPPSGSCDFLNNDKNFYPEYSKASNSPMPIPCPYPIMNYTIKPEGFMPSLKNFPVYLLETGDYMVEAVWKKNGKELAKYQAFGSLINL